jgi:quinoprotein glucose dehydrogenase
MHPTSVRLALVAIAAVAANQALAQSTEDAYFLNCSGCHGPELRGGEAGPTLIGSSFQEKWAPRGLAELQQQIKTTMPPTNPGSLTDANLAAVMKRIRTANGWPVPAPIETHVASAPTQGGPRFVEWLNNRGDAGSTSYSPLDQINKDNVKSLRIAWRWRSDNYGPSPEFYYRVTPIMADGVLYTTAGIRRTVVAIDSVSGETLWMYRLDEGARGTAAPRRNSGRGVAFWRSPKGDEPSRVYTISPGFQLVALDART